jgi:hypothetical protein
VPLFEKLLVKVKLPPEPIVKVALTSIVNPASVTVVVMIGCVPPV